MPLTGTLKVSGSPIYSGAAAGGGTPSFQANFLWEWAIASGVGLSQADKLYAPATQSLAAGANANIDFNAGLNDVFGVSLVMVKLKALLIKAGAANPDNLTLSRPAANGLALFVAASDAIIIPPGGMFAWAGQVGGIPVVASTADLLNMLAAATAGTYTFDIQAIGTSA
jgi:hypothetical protein